MFAPGQVCFSVMLRQCWQASDGRVGVGVNRCLRMLAGRCVGDHEAGTVMYACTPRPSRHVSYPLKNLTRGLLPCASPMQASPKQVYGRVLMSFAACSAVHRAMSNSGTLALQSFWRTATAPTPSAAPQGMWHQRMCWHMGITTVWIGGVWACCCMCCLRESSPSAVLRQMTPWWS